MITLRFLPFPGYSGDGAQRHLVLLQCPSPKGGVCIFYQKVINVPWYNGVKKRRGKTTSWFHYALLISQSHYHKNASMSLENRSIVSMIQLKNLIQPKRWLGDFPPCMVNVHRVMCINTNVSGKHCNESIRSVAIKVENFLLLWQHLACDVDIAAERCSPILWIFELLLHCEDLDRVEFEHPFPPLPLCY